MTTRYRRPLMAAVLTLISMQWATQPLALTESLQSLANGSLIAPALCYATWWSLLLWIQLATDRWGGNERPALSRRYRRPLLATALTLVSVQWAVQPFWVMESLPPLAIGHFVVLTLCYATWWSLLLWTQFAIGRWDSSERTTPSPP